MTELFHLFSYVTRFFLLFYLSLTNSEYSEELHLYQLKQLTRADFNFTHSIPFESDHYTLFPKEMGELVHTFGIQELKLDFTQGRWDYEEWGPSSLVAPSGVQLWAWIDQKEDWKGLVNVLAGLFCASLNFIDSSTTPNIGLSLRPHHSHVQEESVLNYGKLPREAVCTENLTPWAKLLPCQTKAGLASLLNAYKLFDGNYYSMSVYLRVDCHECKEPKLILSQTLSIVLDPWRSVRSVFDQHQVIEWNFEKLFDTFLKSNCPLASTTQIHIHTPDTIEPIEYNIPPDSIKTLNNHQIASYFSSLSNPFKETNFGIRKWNWSELGSYTNSRFPLSIKRYQTGYGQVHGGLTIFIQNKDPVRSFDGIYFESIPWILRLYLHKLVVEQDGVSILNKLQDIFYQPSIDRKRPSVLEMKLHLPPGSLTRISIDFDKVLLKFTEYPPDANRGFDIGSALLTVSLENTTLYEMYTDPILISLPTPDFSMPYNVITMSCTLLALYFGTMFNLVYKEILPVPIVVSSSS